MLAGWIEPCSDTCARNRRVDPKALIGGHSHQGGLVMDVLAATVVGALLVANVASVLANVRRRKKASK